MSATFPVYDIATLSQFTREDIQISRFAPYLAVHKNLYLPHRHNFYHMVLFTEGSGSHAIDFIQFPVKAFQVYFMNPGQVHGWSFEGNVDGFVINFSVPFFQSFLLNPDYIGQFSFFSGIAANSVINLPRDMQTETKRIFERLLSESEEPRSGSADMVRALLLEFFILVSRLGDQPAVEATAYNQTLFNNFRKLVEQHYTTLKLPRDYAALLYVTPNHLNALCQEVAGIAAGEMIRNRVLLEAKRLLVNFDLTISEIAYRLNFQDNSYFSRFFKKLEQITPEEFRKRFNTHNHENIHLS